MEQVLNIKTPAGWDNKKKFVITTYRKKTFDGLNKLEDGPKEVIHTEEITFESLEDLTEMIGKIATYNREELRLSIENEESYLTEKILTQL